MALISVAELLTDPDFVDEVTLIRLVESVGDDGYGTRVDEIHHILASIQAVSENLMFLPDGARSSGSYEIITTFPLQVASETTSADTVLWRGMTFVVTSVGHFGNFAGTSGHYEGMIEMKPVRTTEGP